MAPNRIARVLLLLTLAGAGATRHSVGPSDDTVFEELLQLLETDSPGSLTPEGARVG